MAAKKATPKASDNKTAMRGRMFVALMQIQQTYPSLRLGQIIDNATTCGGDSPGLFFMSDEELVKALETYTAGHSHSSAAEHASRS